MKWPCFCLVASVLSGCLSSSPPAVTNWLVDVPAAPVEKHQPKFGSLRLSQVVVRAPYDSAALTVLRDGGRVAFDPYNRFAAAPTSLLRGPTVDILRNCGLFASVADAISAARTDLSAELVVTRFALDCTNGGCRASVALALTIIDLRTRGVVRFAQGAAVQEPEGGAYSAAFGRAFSTALSRAAGGL